MNITSFGHPEPRQKARDLASVRQDNGEVLRFAQDDSRATISAETVGVPGGNTSPLSPALPAPKCLSAQNKPAESLLIAGYEGLKSSLGPTHLRTLAAAQALAKFTKR